MCGDTELLSGIVVLWYCGQRIRSNRGCDRQRDRCSRKWKQLTVILAVNGTVVQRTDGYCETEERNEPARRRICRLGTGGVRWGECERYDAERFSAPKKRGSRCDVWLEQKHKVARVHVPCFIRQALGLVQVAFPFTPPHTLLHPTLDCFWTRLWRE